MVMVALWKLIETPLYKHLNVTIHHQWESLFALHIDTFRNSLIDSNASLKWKQWKSKELGHAPWLVAL
jgi:hypothetical protein